MSPKSCQKSCQGGGCWKAPLAAGVQCAFKTALQDSKAPNAMASVEVDGTDRFIVAFCGSGTGHMTQAMKVVELLQKQGKTLAGVVTDDDASKRMLEEMVAPLGVEILTLPAVTLIDNAKGFLPLVDPCAFFGKFFNTQKRIRTEAPEIAAYFRRCNAAKIYCFWHITLARYFQLNPLPPSMAVEHIAAQFALAELGMHELESPMEVMGKATIDLMGTIFASSGRTIPISPLDGRSDALPPIVHIPAAIAPGGRRLILCYFLVQRDATRLDKLLAKYPMPAVEFHCFTAEPLSAPRSALHSHPKQRKLFQELFAQSTGVIVSSGNETVWEAVCRGVPVLTIPTANHGEQLLNASVHARNFPLLVKKRHKISKADLEWLVDFDLNEPKAREESVKLRTLVGDLLEKGSPLLQ